MTWLSDNEVDRVITVAYIRYAITGVTADIVREVEHSSAFGAGNPHGVFGVAVASAIEIVMGCGPICERCVLSGTCEHTHSVSAEAWARYAAVVEDYPVAGFPDLDTTPPKKPARTDRDTPAAASGN